MLVPHIKPLVEDEIPLLDAHLDVERLAGRHGERLAQQRDGRLTYRNARGEEREWREVCEYLVKQII